MEAFHAVAHGDAFEFSGFEALIYGGGEFFGVSHEFVDAYAPSHAASSADGASTFACAQDFARPSEGSFEDFALVTLGGVRFGAV